MFLEQCVAVMVVPVWFFGVVLSVVGLGFYFFVEIRAICKSPLVTNPYAHVALVLMLTTVGTVSLISVVISFAQLQSSHARHVM